MSKFKIHGALLIVAMIYGANYSIAKSLMPDFITPFALIAVRASTASILFWLVSLIIGNEPIKYKRDYGQLALLSVFGVAINQLSFFKGLSLTSPISASVILTTSPILVLIISRILLKERITGRKVVGIAFGAAGALMLILGEGLSAAGNAWKGNLLILLNAASYSIYLVLAKPMMLRYSTITVVKWIFTFGSVIVLLVGWNELSVVDWEAFDTSAWSSLIYVVVGTTFFAYLLNAWALNYVNASVVGYYIYLQPLFSTLVAMIFRGDVLSFTQVINAVLIFTGVFLVSYSPRK